MKIDGGCHCGNITYTAEVDPDRVGICHCTDCQTLSGTAFRVSVAAAKDAFHLQGGTPRLIPVEIFAYTIMPNHWHMVLRPTKDRDLGYFIQRLTTTHVRRWHLHRNSVGSGHLYQGTYKSFPIQNDEHFLTVCRYVEQNPLRAGLVQRAEDWRWSSLRASYIRAAKPTDVVLSEWPVPKPAGWLSFVNAALTIKELEELRLSAQRGRPFGSESWKTGTASQLALESTLRARGRPRKEI